MSFLDKKSFDFSRLWYPFCTTTIGQVFAGAFVAIKADMQSNPKLRLTESFKLRFEKDNPGKSAIKGIINIYRGGFWNYSYTLGCSFTGNNLAQLSRHFSNNYTSNFFAQSIISGLVAGVSESSWTATLVAKELSKTTDTQMLKLKQVYRRVFPALALRDSLGWISVQAGALFLENKEKEMYTSAAFKSLVFFVSGVTAAAISGPVDANLRRLYSSPLHHTFQSVFWKSVSKYGMTKTLTAGMAARVAVVSPPFIAYGISQYGLNKHLRSSDIEHV